MDTKDKFTVFELLWVAIFLTIITISTVWFSTTGTVWTDWKSIVLNWIISPVSAVTGVLCVVLSAKGKLSNWVWGLVNSITYGLVAWVSGYYGDWLINWFFFIPSQIAILLVWRKSLVPQSSIVKMKTLGGHSVWISIVAIFVTVGFAIFLQSVDNFFTEAMKRNSAFYTNLGKATGLTLLGPILDSATVVFQVIGQFLMIAMYAEQWPFWIATNVISIFIWGTVIATDPTSYSYAVPTLFMWVAFLANSIYGTVNWFTKRVK